MQGIENMVDKFLAPTTKMNYEEISNAARWEIVHNYLEIDMTKNHLDFLDMQTYLCKEAYNSKDLNLLKGMMLFCLMRNEFFQVLLNAKIGLYHVNHYNLIASMVWYRKIVDTLEALEEEREIRHVWIN